VCSYIVEEEYGLIGTGPAVPKDVK
jgi:hypothetical protein